MISGEVAAGTARAARGLGMWNPAARLPSQFPRYFRKCNWINIIGHYSFGVWCVVVCGGAGCCRSGGGSTVLGGARSRGLVTAHPWWGYRNCHRGEGTCP